MLRHYYKEASEALDEAHKACLNATYDHGPVLGMSHGSFSGVNVALGIIQELEEELVKRNALISMLRKQKQEKGNTMNVEQNTPLVEVPETNLPAIATPEPAAEAVTFQADEDVDGQPV